MSDLLLSIEDLTPDDVQDVFARSRALEAGARPVSGPGTAGLLFLSSSLRTRVGFAAAAARMGLTPIDIHELRFDRTMSAGESLADTIRTVSAMADVLVVRAPEHLDRQLLSEAAIAPLISAGDAVEHPTQALIDLFAIEEERGSVADLRIGLIGDLRFRAVRSLLRLLDRDPPAELRLIAPPGRDDHGVLLGPQTAERTERRSTRDLADLDVVYVVGLPEGGGEHHLDAERRAAYAIDEEALQALAPDAVVLSPMPIIDEISPEARTDRRMRFWAQSDRGVSVRIAVMERMLRRC
jgi:aspartate carbamoyltransferase catalytic subunit